MQSEGASVSAQSETRSTTIRNCNRTATAATIQREIAAAAQCPVPLARLTPRGNPS